MSIGPQSGIGAGRNAPEEFMSSRRSSCRLKLKIYRTLGIDVEADGAGNYNKAVIRNNQKGDVHVVNIDPKFSRYFYANYFWQTMEG